MNGSLIAAASSRDGFIPASPSCVESRVLCAEVREPPARREGASSLLPFDLAGPVSQLGGLLNDWVDSLNLTDSGHTGLGPGKHSRSAEVFPLPVPERDALSEHCEWLRAAVKALNWLAVGRLDEPKSTPSERQSFLLQILSSNLHQVGRWSEQDFDQVPIEDYWKSRSVNGYGEEIHSASYFAWANVKHSLPSKDVAGILDGAEVSTGGVKDFLMHPEKYLKPEATRTWMKCPRVMVKEDQWEEVCAGLVERGVCDVIPVSEVLHVDGKPILGGLFGVPKMEEADGVPVLRLIMDLRPINQCFESIAGDLGTLPMLSQLFPLEVFTEENVLLSSEDIKAMFYIVGLPEVWRPLLAFGREVPSSLAIPGAGPCVLCSRVLPMGFINSVAVAQALHREIVNCAVDRFGINRDAEIRRDQPLPSSATAYRVYLDNFDVLAKTNREASLLLEGQLGPLASELRQVYEELKVPINEKKSVKSGLRGEMQGALVDGVQGTISPKPDKIARYLRGAWYLLQCRQTDLKRIQTVAGGLVYIFSYRRCLMSCLNEVWRFIASFEGHLHQWKEIPQAVKQELFCSMSLTPLAMMNLRAPYDAMATASDASESGGGLSYTSGLTPFGAAASLKPVRGVTHRTPDDEQVLVVSVFDGIAACRVALDVVGAQVAGYVSIEPDAAARRVVESAFGSTEFVDGVQDVTDDTVRRWACKFSRAGLILLAGGPPCQGISGLNAQDAHARFHETCNRIRELLAKHFSWAKVHVMLDSVSSMPDEYRARMTKSIGLLPYQVDALGITPCRRARFFWFDWVVKAEVGVAIATPTSTSSWDYGKLDFHLDCPSDAFLSPGWKLAGGPEQKLPTFTTSQPKGKPDSKAAGIDSCNSRDLSYWESDRFRFPPYQYRYQHGVIHPKHGWRIANVNEREAMLGFPLDYTLECWSKSARKLNPLGHEDARMSLLGNSWSVPVVAFLLAQLLAPLGLCESLSVQAIQRRCMPGQGPELGSYLTRPPWVGARASKTDENDRSLICKLGSLMSTRGTDVLIQAVSEPTRSYDRLRTSVPSKLWKWRTACSWRWKPPREGQGAEHINKLELRAVLTAIKWRVMKTKLTNARFLHLVDSLVSLHIVNKGRSSSHKLKHIMKRISAWLLLSGNSCILGYVDTGQNPADAPSRRGEKRKWSSVK